MSRSFIAALNRIAREADRAARARQRAEKAREREQVEELRREQKAAQLLSKQEHADYLARRQKEVDSLNNQLSHSVSALLAILGNSLEENTVLNIETLKKRGPTEAIFENRPDLAARERPLKESVNIPRLDFFESLIPGAKARHAARVAAEEARANAIYCANLRDYEELIRKRTEILRMAVAETNEFNSQIDAFANAVKGGEADAVSRYFEFVLQKSIYPYNFSNEYRTIYICDSRHLVVDCRLPTLDDVIPAVEKYKYIKSNDEIVETRRPERVCHQLYTQVVAATALRMLHELFHSDQYRFVDVVTVNAFVETIDSSTGQSVKPYILSVRTNSDEFGRLNLQNVEPVACLKRLSAAISRSPAELVPVRPIVDINMVDPRFIQEQDVLSSIDNRTNLMTLSPSEFESLITNLFQKMGLETRLTQPSRDGGVDCVAFDQRPILGGKVVIQAKRYKHTVGVGSVRDLFGTMLNEGASKGILVTTSGYGKASFEFANGKPIELISGANLLYLLREHAGVDAKIEPPEDWVDFQQGYQ
jgi:restriction system protein